MVNEFGGIKWIVPDRYPYADNSWGYGEGLRSLDEFYSRLKGLVKAVHNQDHVSGYYYTQLTDVEKEQNVIYHDDRTDKFDMEKVSRIFQGA